MRKRAIALLTLMSVAMLLGGCSTSVRVMDGAKAPSITLPPAQVDTNAPIGDAELEHKADATLYLPRTDGAHLIAVTKELTFPAGKRTAETLVRALLAFSGEGAAQPLGGDTTLQLYGALPVEVSGGVATVNLSASALQLENRALYIACQAIANTLTELTDIEHVNVLVVDKQPALDAMGTLPMGCLRRSVGTDVGAAFEQLITQRVALGEDAAGKRLTAGAALYFPMAGGDAVRCEYRPVSFASQKAEDMVVTLLDELSGGARRKSGVPELTLLGELMTEPPLVQARQEGGGRVVTLRFRDTLGDYLSTVNVTEGALCAAITRTITAFLPGIAGVRIEVGDTPITALRLNDVYGCLDGTEVLLFEEGLQQRAQFDGFVLDDCTLFLPDVQREHLTLIRRPVSCAMAQNPRFLLLQLMRGPQPFDSAASQALSPAGTALTDADIIGLSLRNGMLRVNFSKRFAAIGEGLSNADDRLLAYALTNTLCYGGQVLRVRYFQTGDSFKTFSDEIDWSGAFYPAFRLAR